MVHYAIFQNRTMSHNVSSQLEIIFATECVILVLNILLAPIIAWITLKAVPLHRNLRYYLMHCFFHIFLLSAIRIPVLWAQDSVDDFEGNYDILLTICTFLRLQGFAFFSFIVAGFAVERMVATRFWAWYEKQSASTLLVLKLILLSNESIGISISYHILRQDSSTYSSAMEIFAIIGSGALILGFIGFLIILRYNIHELRKLRKRGDPDFDRYSLSRTYQLRENVVIMKMILKYFAPVFIFAWPSFFYSIAYFLPSDDEYNFIRSMLLAVLDLWIALTTLNAQVIFPFFDYRFRRSAEKIAMFRFFMNFRKMRSAKTKFEQEHFPVNHAHAANHYFDWLDRDLK